MRTPVLTILFILALSLAASAQGTWTQKTSYPGGNVTGASSFVIGNKAYVGIGRDNTSNRSDFWEWDPCTSAWTQKANYIGTPCSDGIAFAIGSKGYMGLGWDYATYTFYEGMFEYDPSTNIWTAKTPLYGGGREEACGFAIGGKGYVMAGYNGNSMADVWEYEPVSDQWTQLNYFPGYPRRDARSFVIGNLAYMGTGYDDGFGFMNDFWEYDPAFDQWTQKAIFPGGERNLASAFAIGTKGYLGLGTNSYNPLNDFWEWDQPTDTWTQKATYGGPARYLGIGFAIGCKGYMGLGGTLSSAYQSDFWEFYDAANTTATCISTTLSAGLDASICRGQTVKLNPAGGTGTFKWSPATALTNSTVPSPVANPTVTTSYVVTNTLSCGKDTVIVTVSTPVNAQPASDTTLCGIQPVSLNPGGSSAYTYTWSPATGLSCTTCANPVATPTTTTTYLATVVNGACASKDTVVVTIGPANTAGTVTAVPDTVCEGTTTNLNLTGNSSSVIQWQSSGSTSAFTDISGATNITTYATPPLLQSTYYRAVVGSGVCADTAQYISVYVPPALVALFTYTATGSTLHFNSDSSKGGITVYSWDFGDGGTSNQKNPSHTYARTDTSYSVCLTIYDGSNCSYTFCDVINLVITGIQTNTLSGAAIYPNPVRKELNIQSAAPLTAVTITNTIGQVIKTIPVNHAGSISINTASYPAGIYFLTLHTSAGTEIKRFVKE